MGGCVFDNAAESETEVRFRSLESLFDPVTRQHIDSLRAAPVGSRCLEVGGGGGGLVRWLSERVGPRGHVTVTDIDPRFLTKTLAGLRNLELLNHDIGKEDLPRESFDFVHTRLVLEHVPDWEKGLGNMVRSVRRQGRILVEDFDVAAIGWTESAGPKTATERYRKLAEARARIFQAHGIHREVGRRLPAMLQEHGIEGIGFEPTVTVWKGGSVAAELDKANFRQLRAEILEGGLLPQDEFEDALRVFDDPTWSRLSPLMVSVWGHKP